MSAPGPTASRSAIESAFKIPPLWPPRADKQTGTLKVQLLSVELSALPGDSHHEYALELLRQDSPWTVRAVLECGATQVAVAAANWQDRRTRHNDDRGLVMDWRLSDTEHRFWLFDSDAELTVQVLVQNQETDAVVVLATARVRRDWAGEIAADRFGSTKIDCDGGRDAIHCTLRFTKDPPPTLGRFTWDRGSGERPMGLRCFHRDDSLEDRYILAAVRSSQNASLRSEVLEAAHDGSAPFMNPVFFIYPVQQDMVYLSSPLPAGGNLFVHLQRERRFGEERTKRYAAQMVCALKWLHARDIVASLRHEHIMVDCFDRIRLCVPSLFVHGAETTPSGCPPRQPSSKATDWWDLGAFLFEMLVGLPPASPNSLSATADMSAAARDFVGMLLQVEPEKRLGINGTLEVQSHPFLHGLEWDNVTARDVQSFRSGAGDALLRVGPRPTEQRPPRRVSDGSVYEKHKYGIGYSWVAVGSIMDDDELLAYSMPSAVCEAWLVAWDEEDAEFRFSNAAVRQSRLANEQATVCGLGHLNYQFTQWSKETPCDVPGAPLTTPTSAQVKRALVIALRLQCAEGVISRLLDYGMDLDVSILTWEDRYDTYVMGLGMCVIPVTPLEWAVEHQRSDLVDLFVRRGADVNHASLPRRGPALVAAVLRKNLDLVRRLARETGRCAATRALCLAVEQQDRAMVEVLLQSAALCEFEDGDWPQRSGRQVCSPEDAGELIDADMTPPLARAVRLGSVELVTLLLDHGADPNVAYHDLCLAHPRQADKSLWLPRPEHVCGRPVYLAMELGLDRVAETLVRYGADIHLAQPRPVKLVPKVGFFEPHECPVVTRSVHLDVLSRLEAMVDGSKRNNIETADDGTLLSEEMILDPPSHWK